MPSPAEILRTALRLAVGILLVGALGALAHLPLGEPSRESLLRLALRTSTTHVEVCQERTPEELEALPPHMRRPEECRDVRPPYGITVEIDGEIRREETVVPRGIRKNRPLTAELEIRLDPGTHELRVRFEPRLPEGEAQKVLDRLPRFAYRGTVRAGPGEVLLLVPNETSQRLELIRGR